MVTAPTAIPGGVLTVQVAFAVVGLGFAALAIPLWRRRVPPNGSYGLRVPATLADEWVWYEANARSAVGLVLAGLAVALAAVVMPLVWALRPEQLALALVAVLVVATLLDAVWSWRLANRLLRERRATIAGAPHR